jgi:rubrerythrin
MADGNSWTDWWRGFLGLSQDTIHRGLEILSQRYVEESQHIERYKEHARKMQYPQFRDRLLTIAADEAEHVKWIAEQIKLLGGRLPDVPPTPVAEKNSWQYLLDDLNEEQNCAAELMADAQSIREELPSVAKILDRINEDGKRHRSAIRDMLMRSDPQSLSLWLA